MKRMFVLIALLAVVVLYPIGAKAQSVSEELSLFAPNATTVDPLTDWRVRGFVLLTVARINLHDPTVVDEFGPEGIFVFGGRGLKGEAQDFLLHNALPMHLYPDTVQVMRSEGDLDVQLTFSGFAYQSAISTYLWRLTSNGFNYFVDSASYISLAAPSELHVSPIIDVGIQADGISISERMFTDTNVFQFNVKNDIVNNNGVNSSSPFVSVYKADDPNVIMLEAQKLIGQELTQKNMNVSGFRYILSLEVDPLSEGYRAVMLDKGTYVVLKMSESNKHRQVDEGAGNVSLFVVK